MVAVNMYAPLQTKGLLLSDTHNSTVINTVANTEFFFDGRSSGRFVFSIQITGGTPTALGTFSVEAITVANAAWVSLQTTWGTGADINAFNKFSPQVLQTLAHLGVGMAMLDVGGLLAIRFRSSMAGAAGSPVTRNLGVFVAPPVDLRKPQGDLA